MHDRVGKLLERVAQEISRTSVGDELLTTTVVKVLEVRLGPLLRAGQAMYDEDFGRDDFDGMFIAYRKWDEALAALEGEGADGK
jgi:hypothetical protein